MSKSFLKVISFIFLGVVLISSCQYIGAGSYANAQHYTLDDLTEEELIEYIKKFKIQYTDYQVMKMQPDGSLIEDKDYYWNDHFYLPSFYLPKYGLT